MGLSGREVSMVTCVTVSEGHSDDVDDFATRSSGFFDGAFEGLSGHYQIGPLVNFTNKLFVNKSYIFNTHTQTHTFIYIYIYHLHVVLLAPISLTLCCHSSLSSIVSARSSRQYPMSVQSCCR